MLQMWFVKINYYYFIKRMIIYSASCFVTDVLSVRLLAVYSTFTHCLLNLYSLFTQVLLTVYSMGWELAGKQGGVGG